MPFLRMAPWNWNINWASGYFAKKRFISNIQSIYKAILIKKKKTKKTTHSPEKAVLCNWLLSAQ